jgi:hypothetical protein
VSTGFAALLAAPEPDLKHQIVLIVEATVE